MKKLLILFFMAFTMFGVVNKSMATECPNAEVISAAPSLPLVLNLVCGTTNDINGTTAVSCGSTLYMGGLEALYVWTPTSDYEDVTFEYSGQTYTGIFLYEGCPTDLTSVCIGNVTSTTAAKTLAYEGTNQTSGTTISLTAGVTYYIMVDSWPAPPSPCPGTLTINGTVLLPCVGTPNPGNTLSTATTVGPMTNFTLSLENATVGTGVTYQWESSADGLSWSNVGPDAPLFSTTQTADAYYRCQVTCDVNTGTSDSVLVSMAVALAGNYTINSTLPTAGTNFNSFNDFASAINLGGLAGAVTVDVVAGTGPYSEQVVFGELNTDATNTLTINGNGDTLQFLATVSAERYTLAFNGTDYVTVNDLVIVAQGETTGEFGWAVWLTNDADYNTFSNCEFHATTTSTSTNFASFVTSSSATGATTSGLAVSNLTVTNSKIIGGYYGLVINGATSVPYAENNVIVGNEIKDFHLYGLYLRGQNNGLFSENEISRPTRTTTGILYMLYVTQDMSGSEISKNRISGFSTVPSTSTAYGFYGTGVDATVTEELLIANNLIYGFDNMNGTQYGMYMLTTSNTKFYHNTVSLDNLSHTGASLIRAFHQSGNGATIDIRNNIFSVTSNSTGTKYCMYFAQTLANIPVLISDNNVLHMGATSGTNHLVYWQGGGGPNFSTLAAWQAAAANAYDQNSVDADPLFMSPANNDLMPQAYVVDNIGADLLAVVPDDFFGVLRTITPDPGAVEFDVPALNAGMIAILHPEASACGLGIENIEVVIKNFGTTPITSIEAGYSVDGGTPVTEVFSGLNILIDEVDTLTFTVGFDFSVLGIYSLTAFVNLTGDTLPLNDTISDYLVRNGHDFAAGDYFMGFEPTEYFEDWTIVDIGNNGGWQVPHSSAAFANTGSFSAFYNNSTGNTDDDWLFSRCFTFEQGETYELSFFYRSSTAFTVSNIDVYLMDDVSVVATPVDTITRLLDFSGTAFQQEVVRFTIPTTGTYHIAWNNFSAPSTANNSIDDINITLVPAADAAVVEISKPIGACDMGMAPVEIVIVNVGAQPITTAFDVSYQLIGSAAVVTENIPTPNIAVFDTLVYEFTTQADFSTSMDSTFEVMAWASLTNDPIADNDTVWGSVLSGYTPVTPVTTNDTVPYGAFATLQAVSDGDLNWYDDMLGTTLLHTGAVYVTDSIFTDTTYYVQAASGASENVGKPIYDGTGNASSNGWGLVFDVVNTDIILSSVDVFSTGSGGQMEVELRDNTGDLITTVGPFSYPAGSTANPEQVTFTLNLSVPVGTGYRLVSKNMSGNLIREFAAANNFPYESLSSNVIIQSGFINNPGSTTYYWFYNWEVSTGSGCTNPIMVPVSAIVETPICYFVTDVQVDTVTQDYAAIEWMAGGSELQWEIEYGYAGFTQGMGTVQTANATTDTIFGLDHSTHYEFYVRGFCDPNYSAWNGPHSFLTLCGLFTLPFNEDFTGIANGDIPLCWDRTHLNWGVSNSDNAGSTAPEMRFNWSPSTTDTLMVITPEIDATTATSLYLSFMHTVDHYSFGDPYAIGVLASIDAGITWDSLWAVIPTADIDEELVNIDLSAYAGETIHIAWAFAGYTFDINNWYFDNVVIDEISPCVAPSALLADNIEAFAAELSWTGGIDTWEIEWDTTGFTLGTGYSIVTNDNPYILSGLTPETAYDFYVRSYCLFDTTAWEGPVTFSTIATCVAPDSLTAYNITHTTADLMWYSTDTIWQIQWDTAGFVPGTGIFVTTEDNPYALTGLTPSTDYEFWVRAICDTVLGDTSYWTGPFLFTTLDPCFSPINLIVNNVGLDFAELAWTAVGIETEWQIEWDTLGFTPGTGNVITTSDNPYTLTGLDDQTQYEFYVRAICDSLINDTSAWVGPESFTTLGVGITALQSGIGVELYPNPTNGNFNIKTLFDADKLTLTVMNIQGQVIHEEQLNGLTKGSVTEMNLTGFAAGIYYIRLNDGKSILNKKLIIN